MIREKKNREKGLCVKENKTKYTVIEEGLVVVSGNLKTNSMLDVMEFNFKKVCDLIIWE